MRRLGAEFGLELDPEQAARAGEIALPDRMTGIALEAGMQHTCDFRPRCKPARHLETRTMMLRQPHRQRPRAAQREIDVVGPGAKTEAVERLLQARCVSAVRGDRPEHDVGVTADIFGNRMHYQISA